MIQWLKNLWWSWFGDWRYERERERLEREEEY
jgi:hypothetical protein